jgi:hypothetical protein
MPLTSRPEDRPAGMSHAAGAMIRSRVATPDVLLVAQGLGRVDLRRLTSR